MPSLAQLRALAAARRGEAPQSAQLALVPNDDKDELLSSFRRPVGGREAGAPAPAEDVGPPAAAAPAAAALSPVAPTQRLRGTRVAVVDTETTGIDPLTCEVVEVAVVIIPALGEPAEPEVVLHQRVRPSQPIASCQSCGAPIVWIVTTAGAKQPCDPLVRRLMPRVEVNARRQADPAWWHPGAELALVSDNGTTAVGNEDPEGSFEGRQSHFATCPNASRHRKGGERG